jgi:hypothetical protein
MTQRDPADDPELETAENLLGAFNAEEVVDEPGKPPRQKDDPADDADAPAP